MELARRYLARLRRGVEIGAASFAPFPGVRAWNLDRPGAHVFHTAQQRIAGAPAPVHVYASAEALPLRDEALEFVLASHVIEHMPDTIGALGEWDRVLARDGLLFLIVPHRDRNMDAGRPCTDLCAHLADHALATNEASDSMVPTSHYHVWRTADFLALVELLVRERYVRWAIEQVEDVDSRDGHGFTVVARKLAAPERRPPPRAAPIAFHQLVPALPFQVPLRSLEVIVPGAELPREPPVVRGRYRVAAIRAGFPPAVARRFELELGPRVPPPELSAVRWEGAALWFSGAQLDASTWLEATYPDGSVHRALPLHRAGELCVDLTGLDLPAGAFTVAAVNPPPGGGRSALITVPPHVATRS